MIKSRHWKWDTYCSRKGKSFSGIWYVIMDKHFGFKFSYKCIASNNFVSGLNKDPLYSSVAKFFINLDTV